VHVAGKNQKHKQVEYVLHQSLIKAQSHRNSYIHSAAKAELSTAWFKILTSVENCGVWTLLITQLYRSNN